MSPHSDVLLIGGGLAGTLTAFKFATARPDLRVTLLEASAQLGGSSLHTWSFRESDVSAEAFEWLKPLVTRSWPEHTVTFPKFSKTFQQSYHAIRSVELAALLVEKSATLPNLEIRLNSEVEKLSQSHAFLKNGPNLRGELVLDARGVAQNFGAPCGYHKFVGYEVLLEDAHQLTGPVIQDAACPQLDGYRYFYLLPWDEKRLFIRENFYSDDSGLNLERLDRSLRNYAQRRGWKIKDVTRKEQGVLQIPMTAAYIPTAVEGEPLPIGVRGGFFHAATGYSLPDTVKLAEFLVKLPELTTQSARAAVVKFRRPFLSRQRFYRIFNRLLFQASEPAFRYTVFQKLYELPADVTERFYAGNSTWTDRLRIMNSRPAMPLARTLRSVSEVN